MRSEEINESEITGRRGVSELHGGNMNTNEEEVKLVSDRPETIRQETARFFSLFTSRRQKDKSRLKRKNNDEMWRILLNYCPIRRFVL